MLLLLVYSMKLMVLLIMISRGVVIQIVLDGGVGVLLNMLVFDEVVMFDLFCLIVVRGLNVLFENIVKKIRIRVIQVQKLSLIVVIRMLVVFLMLFLLSRFSKQVFQLLKRIRMLIGVQVELMIQVRCLWLILSLLNSGCLRILVVSRLILVLIKISML